MRIIAVALCLLLLLSSGVRAETGDETNAFIAVAKTTFWGFMMGVVVGTALEIGAGDDADGGSIRFTIVAGTFAGLGYGIYHVNTRNKNLETGLLNLGGDGMHVARPGLNMKREDKHWGADVTLFSWSF